MGIDFLFEQASGNCMSVLCYNFQPWRLLLAKPKKKNKIKYNKSLPEKCFCLLELKLKSNISTGTQVAQHSLSKYGINQWLRQRQTFCYSGRENQREWKKDQITKIGCWSWILLLDR